MNRRFTWSLLPAALALCSVATSQEPEPVPASKKPKPTVEVADLGAGTRAPTDEEVARLELQVEVRAHGQIVTEVAEDGAAAKAGLAPGDVLLELDGVKLFSQDDIADILGVHRPGQTLSATVRAARSGKTGAVQITLGAKAVPAPATAGLRWDFASLAHLDAALARAKKEDKLVLVGLSGAET